MMDGPELVLARGIQQFDDVFEPISWLGIPTGTTALTANQAYLVRFRVAKPITVANIRVFVGSATSGNLDAGLYTLNGTTWTRIASAGSTAAGTASTMQTLALTAAVTLVPGVDYWVAFAADNATVTILVTAISLSGAGTMYSIDNMSLTKTASFPLPATLTSLAGVATMVMTRLVAG
ncbi:MAG: DUF4082 domain-containing protein [Thermomicrobiales bacterium]|nr:DUF4082 domain-containing protein [Thermomicrobiales bacterium]